MKIEVLRDVATRRQDVSVESLLSFATVAVQGIVRKDLEFRIVG